VSDAEQLRQLLLERSVRRGSFVLSSGQRSSYYIDCRLATMSAAGQVLIGRMGLHAIRAERWDPDSIGGLTMGADPVAYAIAAASYGSDTPLDAFSVRKDAKTHGTGKLIEGNFASGNRVVVIEDVITTGSSARQAIAAVKQSGGKVLGVLAVVDREEGGKQALEDEGWHVLSLTSRSDLGLDSA
jgi:orotate phosphoribosyltransferase